MRFNLQTFIEFLFPKFRKSIPKKWCGKWLDKFGKELEIIYRNKSYLVSIKDNKGSYLSIELPINVFIKTKNLKGRFTNDKQGNPYLEIEAGIQGIGPTYELYFLLESSKEKYELAKNSDPIEKIIITPKVGLGLYNDWDDDLGAPWTFPLSNFTKIL